MRNKFVIAVVLVFAFVSLLNFKTHSKTDLKESPRVAVRSVDISFGTETFASVPVCFCVGMQWCCHKPSGGTVTCSNGCYGPQTDPAL